jgi:hypothetical protein
VPIRTSILSIPSKSTEPTALAEKGDPPPSINEEYGRKDDPAGTINEVAGDFALNVRCSKSKHLRLHHGVLLVSSLVATLFVIHFVVSMLSVPAMLKHTPLPPTKRTYASDVIRPSKANGRNNYASSSSSFGRGGCYWIP